MVPQEFKTESSITPKVTYEMILCFHRKRFQEQVPFEEHNVHKRKAGSFMVKELQQIPIFAA